MKKATLWIVVVGLFLACSQTQADPQIQVIQLFDEHPFVTISELLPDPVVRETATASIVRGAQDLVVLSSTPDGFGIPNLDDFITINGEFVQSGWFIPHMVEALTGTWPDIPGCTTPPETTLENCFVPHPHFHPVDVSSLIPVGTSVVDAEIWDWGGGYAHTELYLIIVPRALQ